MSFDIQKIRQALGDIDADRVKQFLNDDEGSTAIEYGLICSLIFLVILAGVNAVANTNSNTYSEIVSAMEGVGG